MAYGEKPLRPKPNVCPQPQFPSLPKRVPGVNPDRPFPPLPAEVNIVNAVTPGDIVYLKDGQPIGIAASVEMTANADRAIETVVTIEGMIEEKKFHARRPNTPSRAVERSPCRNCGRMKPVNEWCSNCEGKNFVLRPLADQEVYAALIEEDWNMMGWFVSCLVGIAMASGLTWMVLSAWLKT